jgi:hypothetical protein
MTDQRPISPNGRLFFSLSIYFLACFIAVIIRQDMVSRENFGFWDRFLIPHLLFYLPLLISFLLFIDFRRFSHFRFGILMWLFGIILLGAQLSSGYGPDMPLYELVALIVLLLVTWGLADLPAESNKIGDSTPVPSTQSINELSDK